MSKLLLSLGLFVILGLTACTSSDKKAGETPEAVFERAKELEKDGRSEEAIMKYNEVKNKFPYSKLALEAELAAADVAYNDESYPEAQVSYQLFRDLHPKHSKIPYVIYRTATSIYQQIPEAIDRDLALARSAIETYDDLILQFPDSEHVAEAKEKRLECLKKLAEKELYIANFYLKKQRWESALGRFEGLLESHKGLGFDEKALARAAFAASQANKKELSEKYLARLNQEYPGTHEPDEVKNNYLSR
jgi:outer membrane protein assembly factor BamD